MPERKRTTKKLAAADVRRRIDDVLGWVTEDGARVIVGADEDPGTGTTEGVDEPPFFPEVAAVVPIQDLWRLQALEAENLEAFDVLAEFSRAFEDVPTEALEREVAKAIAEVREENRQRREAVRSA